MRLATPDDVADIMRVLLALRDKSPAYQMRFSCAVTAEQGIRGYISESMAFFFGGFFVMADVGKDWCSPSTMLIERIVLKVHPDDKSWTLEQVITDGLDSLKRYFKADAIVVGDTQIGYMVPRYIAAGYHMIGTQLMKE